VPGPARRAPMTDARAFAACAAATVGLLARRQLVLATANVDRRLAFADGTSARVYRETVRTGTATHAPVLLVVEFRLRLIGRNRLLHALFRAESLANTLLFAGFPGFRWKLWCTDEDSGRYRGVYEWDGADRAVAYATTLSRLLRVVCVPGTVRFHVEPATRLQEMLHAPAVLLATAPGPPPEDWWRPGAVA
jgi:hypothetical protein